MTEAKPWKARFVDITKHMAVECALVFLGEDAETAKEVKWPEPHRHRETSRTRNGKELGACEKIYLFGAVLERSSVFNLTPLDAQLAALGISETHIHWTFFRKNARAVCLRASEGWLWGFGREHRQKAGFRPHQDFAGPLVDYRPGRKEEWSFEPVAMKVQPDNDELPEYYVELQPEWRDDSVLMAAMSIAPSMAPAELVSYEFSRKVPRDPHADFDRELFEEVSRNRR